MKVYVFIFILLFFPFIVNAIELSEWNIDISINDDKSVDWTVTLKYKENVKKSDYFIFASIDNVNVFADDIPIICYVYEKAGTTILCENINAKKIVYKFRTQNFITTVHNFMMFKYRFSLIQLTEKFSLVVRLPLGAAIVEKNRIEGTGLQRFEPSWGREGSDGRKIYVEWVLSNPKLGETFDVSLIYEQIIIEQPIIQILILIIIFIIIIIILFLIKYKKHPIKDMLPVLTEGERKVIEILLREKKPVDQRKIVKETDFSKPKVSRIIYDLEKRGLIEKIHKGRTNIIKLKRIKTIEK
ncbi:MAG: hypothetical protein QXD48_01225 [Candidatus Aenigmatarchaeota archaeon]